MSVDPAFASLMGYEPDEEEEDQAPPVPTVPQPDAPPGPPGRRKSRVDPAFSSLLGLDAPEGRESAPEPPKTPDQGVGSTPEEISPESPRQTPESDEPGWMSSMIERQKERSPYEVLLQSPPIAAARHLASGTARVGSGMARGMELAGGAASDLAERAGLETVARGLEQETERARGAAEALDKIPPLFQTQGEGRSYTEQIKKAPERTPEVAFQAFMENAPQLLIGGAALAKAGKLAGTGWMWLQEAGHEYDTLKKQGASEDEARAGGAATGALNALLEMTPISRVIKGVDARSGKDILSFAMKQSGVEGGTEGLQEFVSNLTERSITGEPLSAQRILEAAATGGLLGLVAGGAGVRAKRPKETDDAQGIQPREQAPGVEEPGAVEEPSEVRPVGPREGDLEGGEARQLEGRPAEPGPEALDEAPETPSRRPPSARTKRVMTRGVGDLVRDGQIETGSAVRTTELSEARRIIEQGGLQEGESAEGVPGISATRVDTPETPIVAYGSAQETPISIIAPPGRIEGEGEAVSEVLIDPKTPLSELRFKIGADQNLYTAEQLRERFAEESSPARPETFKEFAESRGAEWAKLTPKSPEYESLVQEFQKQKESSPDEDVPTIVERVAPRGDEAGFIENPASLRKDIDTFVRRQLSPRGNLPESAWRLKLQKDHNVAAHEKGVEYRLRELQSLIRRYDGPLTDKQLARYLGDALRGYVPLRVRAETSSADRIQIARIARKRGIPEEQVAEEFAAREEEPEGLALAPEFAGIVSKLRADIDGITRGLRREGLLDDANARELERSHGLYVHRTYEAFRGKSKQYLDRVRKEPLWNRAKEILLKEHPDYTESEVDGLLAEMIDRDERPTMPGNVPEGAKNRSTLFQRRSVRDLERLLLGERRDLRAQAVDTLIGQASLLEHHRFLKALREDGLGRYLFERPRRGFHRPIDETVTALPVMEEEGQPGLIYRRHGAGRYDPVGQLRTSPEILRELKEATPSVNDMAPWMKVWMMGNLAVKLNLTAGSIQTQMRNPESNIFPMMTNGYLPVGEGATEALSLIGKDLLHSSDDAVRASLMRFRTLGVTDQNADYGDLRRMGKFADLLRVEQDPGARPVRWVKEVIRKTGQMYSNGDNLAKVLGFYKERLRIDRAEPEWKNQSPQSPLLRRADPSISRLDEEAAARVKETLQNYAELPRLARAVSANPVVAPFFSFTYAMARGLKNTAVRTVHEVRSENPEMRKIGYKRAVGAALGLSLPEMLSNIFGWYSNTDDEDRGALKEFVYPWDKNANLGIVHHEPGRYVYFNWGFMDYFSKLKEPLYAAHRAMTTNIPAEDIAAQLLDDYNEEVLFGAIVDSLRGETASGWEVWMDNDPKAVKIKKSLEHLWETGRPGIERSRERIVEGLKGDRALWPELVALFGPRVTDVDIPDRLNRFGGAFRRAIGQATRQYSQYAHRRDRPERDDLLRGYARANEVRRELIQELRRKIDAGTKSGLTMDEVERALLDGGLPQKYFDLALEGEEGQIPPLDYERGPHWEKFEGDLRSARREER